MKVRPNVLVFATPEEVAETAARRFIESASISIRHHGRFAVALAGGSTPRRAYERLSAPEFRQSVDWSCVDLFFGDERIVPPDSQDSNYRMVHDALISRLAIPPENIHRIVGEVAAEQSVELYDAELRRYFGNVHWPRFDLIWLGMGVDGHTASLFPGAESNDAEQWVMKTVHPGSGHYRVSLTLPLINHAARISFIVTGNEKAATVASVLGEVKDKELPAQRVAPVNGAVEWLLDRAAASSL